MLGFPDVAIFLSAASHCSFGIPFAASSRALLTSSTSLLLSGPHPRRTSPADGSNFLATAGFKRVSANIDSASFLEMPLVAASSANFVKAASPFGSVSYTHLRAHETVLDLVCRLLLEK